MATWFVGELNFVCINYGVMGIPKMMCSLREENDEGAFVCKLLYVCFLVMFAAISMNEVLWFAYPEEMTQAAAQIKDFFYIYSNNIPAKQSSFEKQNMMRAHNLKYDENTYVG